MLMTRIKGMLCTEPDGNEAKDTDPIEPEVPAMEPVDETGNGKEYRRGEFVVRGEQQAKRLLKHDEQAKEVYDGVETQIKKLRRLRKLAEQLLKARKVKAAENG